MTIKLIIGLKNPGAKYERTRHNAGAWFVEALANYYAAPFRANQKLHAEIAQIETPEFSCKLLMPLTFMNQSGRAVRAVCQLYKINRDEVLVAHDELDLLPGRVKVKTGGGAAGHNGLRDIIAQLGGNDFHRLRIGIGHPGHKELVLNYVLGKPTLEDRQLINDAIEKVIASTSVIVDGDMAKAMNLLH